MQKSKLKKRVPHQEPNLIVLPHAHREVLDFVEGREQVGLGEYVVIQVSKGAQVSYVLLAFGGQEVKKDVILELAEGARGKIVCIIIGEGQARFDIKSTLHHIGPKTKGNITMRAVLKDAAYLQYRGMIKIAKAAQQTNSFLEGKALVLDRGSVCNAEPELEIEANDVKASHSFSQSQIDSEQLFYLQSRGISKKQAQDMIIEGFLSSVLIGVSEEERQKVILKLKLKLKISADVYSF